MTRSDRRRQFKEDLRTIVRGVGGDVLDAGQAMALMRVLHALIEESRDAGTVAPLMGFFHDNMRAAGRAAPRKAIACRLGCSHCCKAWVAATAPEVLFVKRSVAPKQREAIRASIDETHRITGGMDAQERSRISLPCPLLKDNVCQAYAARPATCQTAVSGDASICARAFLPGAAEEGIPTPDFYISMRRGYALALAGALKKAGLPSASYEFNAALSTAFSRADAEAAWLAGEDLFAGVTREAAGDPFDLPGNRRLYDAAWAA
jgi:Fe-S-cluster containining protein